MLSIIPMVLQSLHFTPKWQAQLCQWVVEHFCDILPGCSSLWTHVCKTIPLGASCHCNLSNPSIFIALVNQFSDTPQLQLEGALNNRALFLSSCPTTWINSAPYKKLTSNCKQCWSSHRSKAKTLMAKIRLDYVLLDTKLNTKCLTNLVMTFSVILMLISSISEIPSLIGGNFRPDPVCLDIFLGKIG